MPRRRSLILVLSCLLSMQSACTLTTFHPKTSNPTTGISPELACANREKFEALRSLALPLGQYFIIGSGPIGIRNLRVINDIDIIVSFELWNSLAKKHGAVETNGVTKIVFPNINVEAFREDYSFGNSEAILVNRHFSDRIAGADVIEGLAFDSLDDFIFFKKISGRPKDLQDVKLAEDYLNSLR